MLSFIVNPNSRSGMGAVIWEQLKAKLLRENISFEYHLTEYVGHATLLARRATIACTPAEPLHLVAVGGDGTIHEVLSGICDLSAVIFGFIPTGSGNDFCRSMKLPLDPMQALDSILAGKRIMELDVPYLMQDGEHSRFGISTGIGYDAAVCHEVMCSPLKKTFNKLHLGKLIYVFIALKQLLFCERRSMSVKLDNDRTFHFDRVYFAAVMNQQYEGGGFRFCPDARPDDHTLDVILAQGLSKWKLLVCLPTAFFGKHTHVKGIHIYQCRHIDIHSEIPLPIHMDGESGGISHDLSVSLEKKTLKIILPVL